MVLRSPLSRRSSSALRSSSSCIQGTSSATSEDRIVLTHQLRAGGGETPGPFHRPEVECPQLGRPVVMDQVKWACCLPAGPPPPAASAPPPLLLLSASPPRRRSPAPFCSREKPSRMEDGVKPRTNVGQALGPAEHGKQLWRAATSHAPEPFELLPLGHSLLQCFPRLQHHVRQKQRTGTRHPLRLARDGP